MSNGLQPRAAPEVTALPLDDDLILYDERTGESFLLNGPAAHVWLLCDGTQPIAVIAQQVCASYPPVDYAQVVADVHELLDRLHAAGVLIMA